LKLNASIVDDRNDIKSLMSTASAWKAETTVMRALPQGHEWKWPKVDDFTEFYHFNMRGFSNSILNHRRSGNLK